MQGFNMGRYYPPDTDSAPSFNKTSHPLGARAKKINQGILTVRFELPFAVWCTTCKPEAIVGQGVRFNAEKKKVGNYYSTPIWSFRMKHTACGGWWEIRTDPQNSQYVVVDGARRRDYGPDEVQKGEGEMAFLTEEERERRRNDAFASLEGKIEEKGAEKRNVERVEELLEAQGVWKDPHTMNQRLRRVFREERKVLEKEGKVKEGMQEKFSFGYEIADEREIDRVRAGLVEFGAKGVDGEVSRRGLFERKEVDKLDGPKTKRLKSEILQERSRQDIRQRLVGNTKAAIDPFLSQNARTTTKPSLVLKRKRNEEARADVHAPTASTQCSTSVDTPPQAPDRTAAAPISLVNYDSD